MMHSNFPNEQIRWGKLIAHFNPNENSSSSFVLNFDTKNLLSKHKVDSAFLYLKPYTDENVGDNKIIISLINQQFTNNFSWNNKPAMENQVYSVIDKVSSDADSKLKIDVTNLVKFQSENLRYDTPLYLSIFNDQLKEPANVSFFSLSNELPEASPKLEIFFK